MGKAEGYTQANDLSSRPQTNRLCTACAVGQGKGTAEEGSVGVPDAISQAVKITL